MTTTLTYEGYVATVEIDVEVGEMHGEVINTRAVLTFSASDVANLQREFVSTVEDYKAWCAELGVSPEKPYSGTLSLRLSSDAHRRASVCAAKHGKSLNALLVELIEAGLRRDADIDQEPTVVAQLRSVTETLGQHVEQLAAPRSLRDDGFIPSVRYGKTPKAPIGAPVPAFWSTRQ